MNDTTTPAAAATLAAETEASRALAAEGAADNPNPPGETGSLPDAPPQTEEATERAEAAPLERITAADRGRAEIAARFKEKRAAQGGQVEFHGDLRDPSQTYGPYALAQAQMSDVGDQRSEEQPPAQQQAMIEAPPVEPAPPTADLRPPASDEPKLVKVKVHGREAWLPEDQVIAEAQKSLAAGNLLESAKEILSGARGQMSDVEDQRSENSGLTSDIRHPPSDPYVALARTLQLEDAAAAGAKLKQAIESETSKARQEAAREAAHQVRVENELAVSQRALAAFETAHADLAADDFARDAITTQAQREINADLKAAVDQGMLKELPQTQDARNSLHTQLRAFGAPVRSIGEIFDVAGEKYAAWRGEKPATPPTSARPAPTSPAPGHPGAHRAPGFSEPALIVVHREEDLRHLRLLYADRARQRPLLHARSTGTSHHR